MLKKASVLALTALALVPAAALAQSAGDEQYADPLANQGQESPSSQGNGNSGADPQPSQSTNSAGQGSDATPSASTPANSARSGEQAAELPRTGTTVPISATVLGLVLLLAGTVVRRTSRARPLA